MTAREPAHLAPRTRSVSKRIKQKRIIMHRVTARGEETAPPNPEGGSPPEVTQDQTCRGGPRSLVRDLGYGSLARIPDRHQPAGKGPVCEMGQLYGARHRRYQEAD